MLPSSNTSPAERSARRMVAALQAVLPPSARLEVIDTPEPDAVSVFIGSRVLLARWIGRGSARTVRQALALRPRADVMVASDLSLAARRAASDEGVGWADESGAAEIVADGIVVSRTGRSPRARSARLSGWTPVTLSVAEAILGGTTATVSAAAAASGHSASSTARALAFLTDQGLLQASSARGRHSGRKLTDPDLLLDRYAEAAQRLRRPTQLRCGLLWQDPLSELVRLGERWDRAGISWAATGALAAAMLAPYLTEIAAGEVYVQGSTEPALRNTAHHVGLEPIDGGRLLLRPFPTTASEHLATKIDDLRVVPWPRVYADLHAVGVRGEEAAEHLWETVRD